MQPAFARFSTLLETFFHKSQTFSAILQLFPTEEMSKTLVWIKEKSVISFISLPHGGCLYDSWKPRFLLGLIFSWRTFSRWVTARWWVQWAKNQVSTNQNSRNGRCQIIRRTVCMCCEAKMATANWQSERCDHCMENHTFFFRTSWKDSLSKKFGLECDLSCIIWKDAVSFSETIILTLSQRNTWKYDIFFRCFEKMFFKKTRLEHDLSRVI